MRRLSTNGVGKLSRSVELQRHTRSKPEDERIQLNSLNITVPDHLKLLSRNEFKNRTGETVLSYLEQTGFQFHQRCIEDHANWLSSNNTRGRNLRMKKLNLIFLIFRYQTT